MVFHGASRGCANCRKRKQKCDLAWPQCGRCARRNVECPGPTVDAAVWRNSTITARNQRRVDQTISSSRSENTDQAYQERILDWVDALSEDRNTTSPSLYRNSALGPTWGEVAYDAYVPRLLRCAREDRLTPPFAAIADCLMNEGGGHRTTFIGKAITAVSLQTLSFEQPDLDIPYYHAMENYGRAIRSLNRALDNNHIAMSYESLMGAMILSFYGLQAGNPMAFLHYDSHVDGMINIVKLRKQGRARNSRSRRLNYALRCVVLINYLVRAKAIPLELEGEGWFFENDEESSPNSWDTIYLVGVRLAAARGWANSLPDMDVVGVEELFKEARAIHVALKQWHSDTYGGPTFTHPANWEVHINTSPGHNSLCTLSWYRLFQIFTLRTAMQCLERKISLTSRPSETTISTRLELASIKSSLRHQIVGICVCVCSYSRKDGSALTKEQAMPGGFLLSSGWVMQSTILTLSRSLDDNEQAEWLISRVSDLTGGVSNIADRLRYVERSLSKPPSEVD